METAMDQKPAQILFVDDEENILRSLRRLLVDEELEVFIANSGEKALDVLRENPDICLIVSDQRMPGLTGVDFLERSRQVAPDALRILLTGYADITAAIDAINRGGAFRYITKPWKDEDLTQILKDAVMRSNLMRENKRLTEIVKRQNEELKQWSAQLEVMVQEQTIDIQNRSKELEQLNVQLQKNFRNSIEVFTNLMEMRDKTVSSHSKNVAALARQTAAAMSLEEKEITPIVVAALLHDIGKIGIPDGILSKPPELLSDIEQKEYEQHAVRGQVAVEALEEFRAVGIMIRHHHERVDGLGFPDGLKKNDIPIGSRIISLADAYDRLANSVLSPAKNDAQKALGEIEFHLGTRFDRTVFEFMRPFIASKVSQASPTEPPKELEVHPDALKPGMVLSRDVKSGTGLLLLAKGIVLDEKRIAGLRHYYRIDPARTGVFISPGKGTQG